MNFYKICKFISLCAWLSLPTIVHSQYSELYEPYVPEYLTIKTDRPVADQFEAMIRKAHASSSDNIPDEFKKSLDGEFNFNDGSEKKCNGKFRISGDWKDHLNPDKKIASLDITLSDNCYIGGISKFKLFLPNTRNGNNEIFWSILLNEYGFPTLHTKLVDVTLNGASYLALFQEKPSTVFLERHGIRENPIVKHDERQRWETRKEWFYKNSKATDSDKTRDLFAPYGVTIKGIDYDDIDSEYGLIFNHEFLKSDLKYKISINALTAYRDKKTIIENSMFYEDINKSYAPHGLIDHNRRFIYNAIMGTFIPLYYDGNVNTYEGTSCNLNSSNGPTEAFVKKFQLLSRSNITEGMRCVYARIHDKKSNSNWAVESLFSRSEPVSIEFTKLGDLKSGYDGIKQSYVYTEKYVPYIVNPNNLNTNEINIEELRKYLVGNRYSTEQGYKVATIVAGEKSPSINTIGFTAPINGEIVINVPERVKYYVYVPIGGNRKINANLLGVGARILFTGSMNNTDQISISGNAENISKNERHDDQMITGCATFYRFKFFGGSLYSDATGCEDSINIISSSGTIDKIDVRNASADALDLDFSNIKILSSAIETAGNDCIDISSGTYQFEEAKLSNCSDKGVSVGERSSATIRNVVINFADIGIAVKDQSDAKIGNIYAKGIKSRCIDTYIKKNKFGAPLTTVDNQICVN